MAVAILIVEGLEFDDLATSDIECHKGREEIGPRANVLKGEDALLQRCTSDHALLNFFEILKIPLEFLDQHRERSISNQPCLSQFFRRIKTRRQRRFGNLATRAEVYRKQSCIAADHHQLIRATFLQFYLGGNRATIATDFQVAKRQRLGKNRKFKFRIKD